MPSESASTITSLLERARSGEAQASDEVIELIYPTLCEIASSKLRRVGPNVSLETRDLANETYLRIAGDKLTHCESSRHFVNAVCTVVQNLLIDHGRRKLAQRYGGEFIRVTFTESLAQVPAPDQFPSWVSFDTAIEALADAHPAAAEVVRLRYIMGYSIPDTAKLMAIGTATVNRHWRFGRAFLRRHLERRER